jgi:hypothetical protein
LIILHLIIGVAIFLIRPLANIYELLLVVFSFLFIFKGKNKNEEILIAAAYAAGSGVFLRMTGGILTNEFHKYLIIIYIIIGLSMNKSSIKGLSYLMYLLLFIPSIIFVDYLLEQEIRKLIAFNLAGPFCLGITAFYTYKRKLSFKKFNQILFALLLPTISMMVYVIFYSPSVQELIVDTTSNHSTSGGFGPNQVATIFGIAIFILVARLLVYKSNLILLILEIIVLGAMTFRALVTFSRGGVLTALLAVIAFIIVLYLYGNSKIRQKLIVFGLLMSITFSVIWVIASSSTDGIIDKRYANQDVTGREKDDVSTGRVKLINIELDAFFENPIFGIGVGNSKKYRLEKTGIEAASHNEFSRALGEHGVFGVMGLLILLIQPLILRVTNRKNPYFYSLFLIWFLTLSHSATRIAAPSLIYALVLVDIYNEKNSLHRKQIIEKG